MTRTAATLALTLLLPATVWAQQPTESGVDISAELEVRGIFDDNAALRSADPESLFMLAVSPSTHIEAPMRLVDLLLNYRLTYFTYTTDGVVDRAPDFAHDAELRAALTYWEGVDLEVSDRLASIGRDFGLPHDEPENLVLTNTASAEAGILFELGEVAGLRVGYDLDRVDYLDDDALPAYLHHGPELSFSREIARHFNVELGYAFRIQDFDEEGTGPGQAPAGDFTSQNGFFRARYQGSRWSSVDVGLGYQHITAASDLADPIDAFHADLTLNVNPSEYLGFALNGRTGFTADIEGNPAQRQEGRLVASVVPAGMVTILGEIAAGRLVLETDTPSSFTTEQDRQYLRGSLEVDYSIMEYVSARAGFIHQAYTTATTTDGDVSVNRGFVSIVGRYH